VNPLAQGYYAAAPRPGGKTDRESSTLPMQLHANAITYKLNTY